MNRSFDELESLRGVAALLVVFNHIPAWNPALYDFVLFRQGGLMVDLFFVLSGFIIHKAYHKRLNSGPQVVSFMRNRFARLYPLHLATLAIFVLIEYLRQSSDQLGVHRANDVTAPTIGIFFQHLFMVQAIPPFHNIHTFNNPSWSIGVEFYVYLLFALATLLFRHRAVWVALAAFVGGGALILLDTFPLASWFLRGVAGFALGTLVSTCCTPCNYTPKPGRGAAPWVSELLLVSIFGATIAASWIGSRAAGMIVMLLTAAYVLSTILRHQDSVPGPMAKLMRHPSMIWLGTLSFTFYLMHGAVIWFMNNLARFVLKWPDALVYGTWKPQASFGWALAYTLLTVAITLVISHVVKRFYEDPARVWLRG